MTRSIWISTSHRKEFPSLSGDIETDVAIVGGGLSGMLAALRLAREGRRVTLLEMRRFGEGETGHTTAHLTEAVDLRYLGVEKEHGRDAATLVARASRRAIDSLAALAATEGIDCEFATVPGYLFASGPDEIDELRQEAEAASRAGVAASFTTEVPLPFKVAGAVRYDRQAQFHPLRFLAGIAERAAREGVAILHDVTAIEVADGEPAIVRTDRGIVRAREVLITANVPVNQRGILQTKLPAYRSYAVAAPLRGPLEKALYWDTEDPYHYVRRQTIDGVEWLIVGGEDHRTGTDEASEDRFAALAQWAGERFEIDPPRYRWSGQIIEPPDGLPYIGRNPHAEHVFVATGFSGQGMTFGAFSGDMLSDLVLGRTSEWTELFDPKRLPPLADMGSYVKENLEFPKRLVLDRLTAADVEGASLDDVAAGEGKIVEIRGHKIAVSRTADGATHLVSAVCPHLGCHVSWNRAERTWDCPCHGSRFEMDGTLVNGPASTNLDPEQRKTEE